VAIVEQDATRRNVTRECLKYLLSTSSNIRSFHNLPKRLRLRCVASTIRSRRHRGILPDSAAEYNRHTQDQEPARDSRYAYI
jgi:hypothetical protein